VGALKTWVSADPDAALRWLAAAEQLDLKDIHYSVVFRQLARKDPRGAVDRAQRLEDRRLRGAAVHAVLETWSQEAPEDALAWAETREEEGQRNEYAARVLDGVKQLDPQRAIEISLKAQNPHVRSDGILYAMLIWCQLDPVAAVQAFVALPEKDRNEQTLRQMAVHAASSSLEQSREFLARIPAGSERLAAQAAMVMVRRDTDPASVADLALPLAESPSDSILLRQVVFSWHKLDPAAVERWIAALPDSPGKGVAAQELGRLKRLGDGRN